MLAHEKLDVYRRSIEFLALSARIGQAVPRGSLNPLEQLKRAALSIPLNIAEGAGEQGAQDRTRYYGSSFTSTFTSMPVDLEMYKLFLRGPLGRDGEVKVRRNRRQNTARLTIFGPHPIFR